MANIYFEDGVVKRKHVYYAAGTNIRSALQEGLLPSLVSL